MSDDLKYPSQLADRFQVRMPEGLRDRIKIAADKNNRSMNAEIIATLEDKYPDDGMIALDNLHSVMSDVLGRIVNNPEVSLKTRKSVSDALDLATAIYNLTKKATSEEEKALGMSEYGKIAEAFQDGVKRAAKEE